jgi:hypothetical protein
MPMAEQPGTPEFYTGNRGVGRSAEMSAVGSSLRHLAGRRMPIRPPVALHGERERSPCDVERITTACSCPPARVHEYEEGRRHDRHAVAREDEPQSNF